MVKKLNLLKISISSVVVIFAMFLVPCYSFTLEGVLNGNNLTFRNLENGISGSGKTLSDWTPSKNLLPAISWSPGFKYQDIKFILTGPKGKVKVDISEAISVIGMEYRTYNDLEKKDDSLPGVICNSSSNIGNTTYAVDERNISCHGETYDSYDKMPFYFMRPILDLDNEKIKEIFESLAPEDKIEGIYSTSVSIISPYFFKLPNKIETWQNITSLLNVQIAYKAGYKMDVHLEDPSVHEIKFISKDANMLLGSTTFNVIATGAIPHGLVLNVPKTSEFTLKHDDPSVAHPDIPLSVLCPDCSDSVIVDSGTPVVEDTIVNLSGNNIRFPIIVKVLEDKNKISLGDYSGNFVLNFGLNL